MDIGQLDGALNALDVLRVKRNPDGSFNSIISDGEDQGVVTAQTNPLTGGLRLSGVPIRWPSIIRAGAIGDSTVAGGLQNAVGVTVQVGQDYLTNYAPANVGAERGGSQSWLTHLCLLSGGSIINNHNGGVASDTSAGCLARIDYELSQSPDVLFMQMGITNDIQGGIPTADSKANVIAAITRVRAAGVVPILVTPYPHNTAAYGVAVRAWNEWLKNYGFKAGVPVIDVYSVVADPASTAGNWLAANTADGVHATCLGASRAGAAAVAQLVQFGLATVGDATKFPRLASAQFGGTANEAPGQLIKNGLFLVDTNADGLADSWTCSVGTKTINTSPGTGVVGNSQKVAVVAGNQPTLQTDVTVIEGRRYAFTGLFKTSGCTAGGITYSIGVALTFGTPQRKHIVGLNFVGVDFDWTPFYVEFTAQTGATLARAIPLEMSIPAIGNAEFEFAMLRWIDLTAIESA